MTNKQLLGQDFTSNKMKINTESNRRFGLFNTDECTKIGVVLRDFVK